MCASIAIDLIRCGKVYIGTAGKRLCSVLSSLDIRLSHTLDPLFKFVSIQASNGQGGRVSLYFSHQVDFEELCGEV